MRIENSLTLDAKQLTLVTEFSVCTSQPLKILILFPGGGINERNLTRILSESHATEFHCSARSSIPSKMSFRKDGVSMGATFGPPEYSVKVTDRDKVQKLVAMATNIWDVGT